MADATRRPRALVVDDRAPREGRDAGSDAVLSHMRALRRLGYDVSFAAADPRECVAALEASGFATFAHPSYTSVEDVLRRQSDPFELVYLHRLSNASRYLGLARHHQPGARIVYSVADLHFLRAKRQAQVENRPDLLRLSERQRLAEFAHAAMSDAVITYSTHEAALLRAHLPHAKVHVVPWDVPPRPVATPFGQRRGVAFVAHYAHQPNADAALSLLERILPKVRAEDPAFPCLLVGSSMPDWLRRRARPPTEVVGEVPDLATVFERVRSTVAPLFYGAGIKGKVLASLAAGIPCACTSIAAEGLDLPTDLDDLIADDSASLASLILRLENDEAFNRRCADAGLSYVSARLSERILDQGLRAAIT